MTTHILTVSEDLKYSAQFPDFPKTSHVTLDCPENNGCSGWVECQEDHVIDGKTVGDPDDPEETDEDDPWAGAEEFEIHGVLHTWQGGYGWCVDIVGCAVTYSDWEAPDHAHDLPYGNYEVDAEWDEEVVILTYADQLVGELVWIKHLIVPDVYSNNSARAGLDHILTRKQVM